MTIKVERFSFYKTDGGTNLRYVEHAPEGPHEEHFECGCTKNVKEKPTGEPDSVHQIITIEEDDTVFLFSPNMRNLAFRKPGQDRQAYFFFGVGQSSVKMELAMPGYGIVDTFFSKIYQGDHIDLSHLYNGHSPSEVLKNRPDGLYYGDQKIEPSQVWTHVCSWGKETVKFLSSDSREHWLWRDAFDAMAVVELSVKPFIDNVGEPVEKVRADVEACSVLVNHTRFVRNNVSAFVLPMDTIRMCEEAEAEVIPPRTDEERLKWRAVYANMKKPSVTT